jgi:hypothetical protein
LLIRKVVLMREKEEGGIERDSNEPYKWEKVPCV